MTRFEDVDEYLAALSDDARERLQIALDRARRVVPGSGLVLSYQMPTVTSDGRRVVHLAAWKHHLAVYPAPDDPDLEAELAPYQTGQGTLRFPFSEPIPYELIDRVVIALDRQSHSPDRSP